MGNEGKITPYEAAKKLVAKDENGKYEIGDLNGPEERQALTGIVRTLSQVDLNNKDPKEWQVLRKALGMVGAYDKYATPARDEKKITAGQLPGLSKSGDMDLARLYVRNFFNTNTDFGRAALEDVFNPDIMKDWIEASDRLVGENSRANNEFEEAAKAFDKEVSYEERAEAGDAIKDVREEEQIVVEAENVKSDEGK